MANAQEVLSQNAVGYVKVEAERGNLYLLRNDFQPIDPGQPSSVANIFGEQVPANTVVTLFDEASQSYLPGIGKLRSGWAADATNIVDRGRGMFLRIPDAAPEPSYDVFIMGEVPDMDTPLDLVPGINMIGYAFPADRAWTNTSVAIEAPPNSVLTRWDPDAQEYLPGIGKLRSGAWGANPDIKPGEGFFLTLPTAEDPVSFDEVKPYTWP